MSNVASQLHGVMESKGSYNKHAIVPAGGAALGVPLLEKAVQNLELDPGEQSIVIADYGSSQGKNSMLPMQVAIQGLRRRAGANRAISVFHIDQPSNDFATLFAVLGTDPDRYVLDEPLVFPAAIGRSFYENVLPPDSVHVAWSSFAAVWLSQIPTLIPGHFVVLFSTASVRSEFERQAAKDWEAFLALRAKELRPGGRLVVVLPALADDGLSGLERLFDEANEVLGEMVAESEITAEERSRMVLGGCPRTKRGLLAPFAVSEKFQQLTVEAYEMHALPDAAWADYQLDGDKEALVSKKALFFCSVFAPSLASALDRVRSGDAEALGTFGNLLVRRLKRRLASRPTPMHSFVHVLVLAKAGQH